MYRKIFLIVQLLFSFYTFASEEVQAPTVSTDIDLPTTVADCVNVISGDFFLRETDLVDISYYPLEFQRKYDSGGRFFSEYGFGTGSNFPVQLAKYDFRNEATFQLDERQGSCVFFDFVRKGGNKFGGSLNNCIFENGYVDSLKSILGAAFSVRNMKLSGIQLKKNERCEKIHS